MWLGFEGVGSCPGPREWGFQGEEWSFGRPLGSGVFGREESAVGGVESEFGGLQSTFGREWKVATFDRAYHQVRLGE